MEDDVPPDHSGAATRHGTAMPPHCLDSPDIDILSPSPPTVSPITLPALHSRVCGHHLPSPYQE